MRKKEEVLTALLQQKMLPLFYNDDENTCIGILQTLYENGIRMVEFTHRGENALSNFIAMKKEADSSMPGMLLGIGTIKNPGQARMYVDAGADYIICPTVDKAVGELTIHEDMLWIPGCVTPTEISLAEQTGASIVKIFPGSILGPSYIAAIRDIFPGMLFMPTGGVDTTEQSIRSWFDAGVSAVGMGSKLVSSGLSNAEIGARTRQVMDIIGRIAGSAR